MNVLQSEYNIEPLLLRRQRNLVKIIHKTSRDETNLDLVRPKMDLRSKPKVKLKMVFTSNTKVYNSPLYRGMRLWDQLPPEMQKEKNNVNFKNGIKQIV